MGPPPGLPAPAPARPIENIQRNFYNHNNQFRTTITTFANITGIFFDNDENKIDQVRKYCNNIILVKIPESEYDEIRDKNIVTELLSKNATAFDAVNNIYFELIVRNRIKHDKFDKLSGIQQEHIDKLVEWIQNTKDINSRYAFFDWDRTLSMCEGTTLPIDALTQKNIANSDAYKFYKVKHPDQSDVERENRIYEDMSIYLAGGNARLQMLRDMFNMLHNNSIKIVILTNNGACVKKTQSLYFMKLARKFVGYDDIEFVCSSNILDINNPTDGTGNKGHALASNPKYKAVCEGVIKGGRRLHRRSNHTRKHRHRRHKTRRHK